MQVRKVLTFLLAVVGLGLAASCATSPRMVWGDLAPHVQPALAKVDLDRLDQELVAWLGDYLRTDTTNPPGNETRGAELLATVLAQNGIGSQILEFAPGRGSLVARVRGTGKLPPLCLLSHIDVVTANAQQWPRDRGPLSGAVHEGEIWGRGALDMKSMGILELAVLVAVKRSGVALDRDLVLLAVADEEVDNRGIKHLVADHWDKIGCSHLVNEGGLGVRGALRADQTVFAISTAEKGLLWVKMTARGKSGHGSTPMPDRAPDRLLDALQRLRAKVAPVSFHPSLYATLGEVGAHLGGVQGYVLQRPALVEWLALDTLLAEPGSKAMLTNTIAVTGFFGAEQPNVVPDAVSAQLDCRLLPGTEPRAFLYELQKTVADPQVEFQVLHEAPASESPPDDPLFLALGRHAVIGRSDAVAGPLLSVGFTDSLWVRQKGVRAYGFVPVEVSREIAATFHGANERVPIAAVQRGMRVLLGAVVDFAAHR
ncbi:MAG: M20/M25/M40 family metallo-hydrolase [Deltaproteobacteria bacterium]|nr:M20/M25/M40 family metallo-hydrolase [Deltaproteobacteria bacterium]